MQQPMPPPQQAQPQPQSQGQQQPDSKGFASLLTRVHTDMLKIKEITDPVLGQESPFNALIQGYQAAVTDLAQKMQGGQPKAPPQAAPQQAPAPAQKPGMVPPRQMPVSGGKGAVPIV